MIWRYHSLVKRYQVWLFMELTEPADLLHWGVKEVLVATCQAVESMVWLLNRATELQRYVYEYITLINVNQKHQK